MNQQDEMMQGGLGGFGLSNQPFGVALKSRDSNIELKRAGLVGEYNAIGRQKSNGLLGLIEKQASLIKVMQKQLETYGHNFDPNRD